MNNGSRQLTERGIANEVERLITALADEYSLAFLQAALVNQKEAGWEKTVVDAGLALGDLLTQDASDGDVAAAVLVRQFPGIHAELTRFKENDTEATDDVFAAPGFINNDYPLSELLRQASDENTKITPPWFGPRRAVKKDFVSPPPTFPWHVASIFSAFLLQHQLSVNDPASFGNPLRKGLLRARYMATLDSGRKALAELAALVLHPESGGFPDWAMTRAQQVLGTTTAATRLVPRSECEQRLAPFLDKLGHIWGARGLLLPIVAPDDGLTACISLTAVPGEAVSGGVAYPSLNLLTWAGLQLRLEFDEKVDLPICLQLLGHRPELSVRYADEPDLAARLPIFVDPCSWIGLAGVVAFVLIHGDRYGILVIDPQSTINKLRVYTRQDTPDDAEIIVLTAPVNQTGWAAVQLTQAVTEANYKQSAGAGPTTTIPWSALKPHTAVKEVQAPRTFRSGFLGLYRDSGEQTVVDRHYPTVQHMCVDIETNFLRETRGNSAVRYACATTSTLKGVEQDKTDDDYLFSQSIPRQQVNTLPRGDSWGCDGETNWKDQVRLASWRYPGSADFPGYTQRGDKRWKQDMWVAREHSHARELPNNTMA